MRTSSRWSLLVVGGACWTKAMVRAEPGGTFVEECERIYGAPTSAEAYRRLVMQFERRRRGPGIGAPIVTTQPEEERPHWDL